MNEKCICLNYLPKSHMSSFAKFRVSAHSLETEKGRHKKKLLTERICPLCKVVSKQKLDRVNRIWYLSPMRAAKIQANLRIRAVSPEPPLLVHTSSESRGAFRQKARSLAPLNGWACAVTICHDGMLEDTSSLDAAQIIFCSIAAIIRT